MSDAWDDSDGDDEWDVDSDEDDLIAQKLNKLDAKSAPAFDEEDLAVKEKAQAESQAKAVLKTKGNAMAAKKLAEKEKREEEELVRKAMELELKMEEAMDPEERRLLEKKRIEEADNDITDDLFGGVDARSGPRSSVSAGGAAIGAGDTVKMKDLKDHLKHARKVAQCMKDHGKVHLAAAFLKEVIQESKDVLDDDAVSDLIKTCNVIKNDKVAAAKRKVKGQAQKSKRDKAAEAKAKKIQTELYGDNDQYDQYDEYGADYEDDFF
mmetsp:Transcript_23909/g.34978  ORF Transcript_23909/g.34978 Transcript_23909/m.34978 type:complete len:266 (-) Transcript_23909:152-949(-)|eukprot:CAMPEP_0195519836 /NCGR_PEP_ID=MMETSP0794_2-20130614/15597_1 /TAXON_ID=515487 /ORGANISM="Stephanopyxis turris, Strain CCMP 815" /LENGTH=265 /DNA_ID=CAMNT_0040649065 /DNA_START=110 /DNA_END=907 /DNA_ORIENTATION=+